jgi:hypothetical protein
MIRCAVLLCRLCRMCVSVWCGWDDCASVLLRKWLLVVTYSASTTPNYWCHLLTCPVLCGLHQQDDSASVSDPDGAGRHGDANNLSMQLGGRYGGRMDVSMIGEDSNSMDVERMLQQ